MRGQFSKWAVSLFFCQNLVDTINKCLWHWKSVKASFYCFVLGVFTFLVEFGNLLVKWTTPVKANAMLINFRSVSPSLVMSLPCVSYPCISHSHLTGFSLIVPNFLTLILIYSNLYLASPPPHARTRGWSAESCHM